MPAFISEWKTDNAGTSEDNQITLPLVSSGTYDFTVDWGDGSQDTITSHDDAAVTHTYAAAGTYTVEITGTISGWQFNNNGDQRKIMEVLQWGTLSFGDTSGQFYGAHNLFISADDAPDLSNTTSLYQCFQGTHSRFVGSSLEAWDVSNITNFARVFLGSHFNGDLYTWDVSNGLTFERTFQQSRFNNDSVKDWDVSGANTFLLMFWLSDFDGDLSGWVFKEGAILESALRDCPFNNGSIKNWNVSPVSSLRRLFLDNQDFDQDISGWDISGAANLEEMLRGSGISDLNYSRCLVAWSRLPLQSGVEWTSTNAQYFSGAAAEARAKIASDFGWTISDNGEDTTSTSYSVVGQVLDGTTPLTGEPVVWTSEQDVELDEVTSALHGAQEGRFAVMTTDSLTFPNDSDVNGTTVTLEEATFIYEQDVGPVAPPSEDHTAVVTQVFPAPLQSASASHTEPESHTATASQVFPAPLQSATATHAAPENHSASASQVFPAPIQSATVTHSSVEGNSASATQVFPAPLQSATATHAAPENHSAAATQVFPAPLQSALATHTAAASHTASAAQVFPAPLQSAVATHVAPESHTATATQVFPAPIQAAVVVHSDRELKAPVRAQISSAQRFTSNTSTSERIQ